MHIAESECRMRMARRDFLLIMLILGLSVAAGCAANPTCDSSFPEPRPLGNDLASYLPPTATSPVCSRGGETIDLSEPTGSLTLPRALALALMKNPALAATAWEVRVAEAKVLQAQLFPNPVVEAGAGSLFQSRNHSNRFVGQKIAELSQTFELSGKRAKRARVAALDADLVGWDYETRRLDVFTEVTKYFVDMLAFQEQVALYAEMERQAEEMLISASGRIKGGKAPRPEIIKVEIELSNIRVQEVQAADKLKAARRRLAGTWGQKAPAFEKVEGVLSDVSPVPSYEELSEFVSKNPDVARWVKETEQRSAALALENAKAIPDVTLGGGAQQYRNARQDDFIFGLSLPIPIFDRNQGNALAAEYRLEKARAESMDAAVKVNTALGEAHQVLLSSYREATGLRDKVLPAMERLLNAHCQRLTKDQSALSDVVDARQALRETRVKYVEALAAYHKARADVERLIGERLDRCFR